MESMFEKMGGTYTEVDGYLLPELALPAREPLGVWGRRYKVYLKNCHEVLYNSLLLEGSLYERLAAFDQIAAQTFEQMVNQLVKSRGITERLKADEPMRWVGEMNNIRSCATEVVMDMLGNYI
jgi:hypothetical protein